MTQETKSSRLNAVAIALLVVFLDERVSSKELVGLVVAGIGTLIVQLRSPSSMNRIFRRRVPG